MSEQAASTPPLPASDAADPVAVLATLRQQGADRLDPIRFQRLQALAQRAQAQPAPVKRLLDAKLATALADYRQRIAQAETEGTGNAPQPDPATSASPLTELLQHIARHSQPATGDGASESTIQPAVQPTELKSMRQFGDSWARLSVRQTVNQALASAPSNAGPLNSQALVLQALQLMRDTAPDYLVRFMAYADTLVWLEQAHTRSAAKTAVKKTASRSTTPSRRKKKAGDSPGA